MREYQRGNTFDSISDMWIVFIPRAIWPNKPRGIGPGKDFYYYATGRESSRSSVTVYGDAFWNFGWIGLLLVGGAVGFAFGKFSEIAYYWLRTDQVVYYPVLFAGIDLVMRGLNSWILNGLVGRSVIIVGYIGVLVIFVKLLKVQRQPTYNTISSKRTSPHTRSQT